MRSLVAIAAIAALVLAVVLAASSAGERDDRAARPQPLPHLFTVLPKQTPRQVSTGRRAHHARQVHHVRRHAHHHRHHYGTYAHPNLFGTDPLPISIGASREAANGPSGGATVSGDNLKMRL